MPVSECCIVKEVSPFSPAMTFPGMICLYNYFNRADHKKMFSYTSPYVSIPSFFFFFLKSAVKPAQTLRNQCFA